MSNDPNSPNPAQLVERWENVERVLRELPEHERTKHFDMSEFIEETDCGTVCCAAGFCAFDPWFHGNGWKAEKHVVYGWWVPGGDIHQYFGIEGSDGIFHDYTPRPIESVIEEVHEHTAVLRKRATGFGFAMFRKASLTALLETPRG